MRIERAAIVGNSLGCQIAVALALLEPGAVDRLTLIGPTLDPAARNPARLLSRTLASGIHERPSLLWLLALDYLRMAPRLLHELQAMRAHCIEQDVRRLTVPVLFVRGARDAVAPQGWIEALAARTPESRTAVIERYGHAVHYSAADRLVQAIEDFLMQPASMQPASHVRGRGRQPAPQSRDTPGQRCP
jgi:pimeloyl-ACP methyl ester carboxylesterase